MKVIHIKANEKKRIISQFSNSLRQTHNFSAESVGDAKDPSGLIEVKGSNWLLPKDIVPLDLKRENSVDKGAWDTFYSVHVTPETDTKITLTSSPVKNIWLYVIIMLVIIAFASTIFFAGGA